MLLLGTRNYGQGFFVMENKWAELHYLRANSLHPQDILDPSKMSQVPAHNST
jgi:hypothetical protein